VAGATTDEFDYDLPPESIAQRPRQPRTAARLLVALDPGDQVTHSTVGALARWIRPGDALIVNETRVDPARLHLRKATGARVEVLLLEKLGEATFEALVRPGRRVRPGTTLYAGRLPALEVGDRIGDDGRRLVRILASEVAEAEIALPPYIHEPLADAGRYQTVYARRAGSVAAPTAGLHFTDELLEACRAAGASLHTVDLSIGLDTFRPIATERVEDHVMHSERYSVPEATMAACRQASRVIAVGTTTVRALEAAAATGRTCGRTSLFIHGSYPFRVVDLLLTNFHAPRSTLLVLLEAFCGSRWRSLYQTALAEGYRFLSFGDAMLVGRQIS
jgi:S-adenosylmethionine:tRNA ribosyltransferase-isomerase